MISVNVRKIFDEKNQVETYDYNQLLEQGFNPDIHEIVFIIDLGDSYQIDFEEKDKIIRFQENKFII